MDQIWTCHFKIKLFGLLQEVATPMSTVLGVVIVGKILYTMDIDVACVWLTILRICITKLSSRYSGFLPRSPGHCQFSSACGHMDKGCSSISSYSIYGSEHLFTYNWFNGEANNFKMELFNDIDEGSGGC